MTNMKELLERLQAIREDPDCPLADTGLKFPEWRNVTYGCQIEIEWRLVQHLDDEPLVDRGYIFVLPDHMEPHMIDAIFTEGIVHIPTPAGVEQEANIPEWVPLVDLIDNIRVESIRLA